MQDNTDPSSQKMALTFFSRCISVWGQRSQSAVSLNGNSNGDAVNVSNASNSLPGFDGFVYERLIPLAFNIPFAGFVGASGGVSPSDLAVPSGVREA